MALSNKVNIFLSTRAWSESLVEGYELKQHVRDLYETTFDGKNIGLFPRDRKISLWKGAYKYIGIAYLSRLNILCPDYPVIIGFILAICKLKPNNVFHTWVVPFHSKRTLKTLAFDVALYVGMMRSSAIVVASDHQKKLLKNIGVKKPIFFSPVSVDSHFWCKSLPDEIFEKYQLKKGGYILTVGGSDRDEEYSARLARILNLDYVRCGYDKKILDAAKLKINSKSLTGTTTFIENPSHLELRALYSGCALLCLPTIIKTNPAGLTSMVEGMSCGALVAYHGELATGYFEDEQSGLFLCESENDLADKFVRTAPYHEKMRAAARNIAINELNVTNVAAVLKSEFLSLGLVW